jgi:hypothetical protein
MKFWVFGSMKNVNFMWCVIVFSGFESHLGGGNWRSFFGLCIIPMAVIRFSERWGVPLSLG